MLTRHDKRRAVAATVGVIAVATAAFVLTAAVALFDSPTPAAAAPAVKVLVVGKAPTSLPELTRAAAKVRAQIGRASCRERVFRTV